MHDAPFSRDTDVLGMTGARRDARSWDAQLDPALRAP
jgi:hypothetical protein